jgi:hypothetical protein
MSLTGSNLNLSPLPDSIREKSRRVSMRLVRRRIFLFAMLRYSRWSSVRAPARPSSIREMNSLMTVSGVRSS